MINESLPADKSTFGRQLAGLIKDKLQKTVGIIDSDDHGMFLTRLLLKLQLNDYESLPADKTISNFSDLVEGDPIRSYYNVVACRILKRLGLNMTGNVSELAFADAVRLFEEQYLPLLSTGPYSLLAFSRYRLPMIKADCVLVFSHNSVENVRAVRSDLFFRLVTCYHGPYVILSARDHMDPRFQLTESMNRKKVVRTLKRLGMDTAQDIRNAELFLYYYYKSTITQDVAEVSPGLASHMVQRVSRYL